MSQVPSCASTPKKSKTEAHQHTILITKPSSSPPRSRSQSTGSAHKEALLFFERHKLFQPLEVEVGSSSSGAGEESSSEVKGVAKTRGGKKNSEEEDESRHIRNRSIRGRSHSQPDQVLLSTSVINPAKASGRESIEICTGSGGAGDLCGEKERKRKYTNSWLEQIQFNVQYQHYRTNDYSSVVNSASSLDKAGVGEGRGGEKLSEITTNANPANSNSSPTTSHQLLSKRNNSPKPQALPQLCFHFPKLPKLPRIFNAKSLDDIFGSKLHKVPTSTFSSHSPHPPNLEIVDDPSSLSSIGITTPGITNTTGATATSGYFSEFDRRESSDLLVAEDFGESSRRSTASYLEGKGCWSSGEREHPLPQAQPFSASNSSQDQEKLRKQPILTSSNKASTLSSAFSRLAVFSDKNKSPKAKKNKKPSKSLSSGSLNRVAVLPLTTANNSDSLRTTSAKASLPKAKNITKSDNYINRIVSSTAGFRLGGAPTGIPAGRKGHMHEPKKSSESGVVVGSDTKASSTTPTASATPQRKWTAVKQKWDLKLQLQPSSDPGSNKTNKQQLIFIKTQLAQLDPHRSRRSLDELESLQIEPHEAGRVSFRLDPEEIPPASPVISRSQSSDCRPVEICSGEEEMGKTQHFHYISNTKSLKVNQNSSPTAFPKSTGATLLIANVSYLQRPNSPCLLQSPASGGGTPTSSTIPASPIVFNNETSSNINETRQCGNINTGFSITCCTKSGRNDVISPRREDGANNKSSFCDDTSDLLRNATTVNSERRQKDLVQRTEPTPDSMNKMGDLQSPTYVKRTIHMFNSIFSQQNESATSPERKQPSYLNVSKSVSGYSCISYNNSHTHSHTNNTNGFKVSPSTATVTKLEANGYHHYKQGGESSPKVVKIPIEIEKHKEEEDKITMKSVGLVRDYNRKSFGSSPIPVPIELELEPCPGKHRLETITLDKMERQFLITSPAHEVGSSSKSHAQNGENSTSGIPKTNGESLKSTKYVQPALDELKNEKQIPLSKMIIVKDGNYFLQEMRETINELTRLSENARAELEGIDEQSERAGNILAAIGKSNLLVKKKFKQFEELCNANLRGVTSDEPETTNEDLAGFWDMVLIQVQQVYSLFKDINENTSSDLPASSSQAKTSKASSTCRKLATKTPKCNTAVTNSELSAAAKARDESRRKMLAEKRRQMKDQIVQDLEKGPRDQDILIFTPDPN